MKGDAMKTALIVLSAAALALLVLTVFVVFSPTGTYQPVNVPIKNGSSTTSSTATSSMATTSAANASSSAITNPAAVGPAHFASEYTYPYPVTWTQGQEIFAITSGDIQGNQITLTLAIQMGNIAECVPVNVRLVADENGTLVPPSNASSDFIFPDTQTCKGMPGATYSESLIFTAGPSVIAPYLFTTGGTSNVFFNVATSTSGGVDVALPGNSG